MICGYECDCESVEAHRKAERLSLAEFLADPGPPPAHWDEETKERVQELVDAARTTMAFRK